MARQRKTPRQRAEEDLAVAERAVVRLNGKRDQLAADLDVVEDELAAAVARRDHLEQHPDLQQHPTTTSTGDNT